MPDETLHDDGELVLVRRRRAGACEAQLRLTPSAGLAGPGLLDKLRRSHHWCDRVDPTWGTRPLQLDLGAQPAVLTLHDPGGQALSNLLGEPWPIERFLSVAIGMGKALAHLHAQGLMHRDLQPGRFLVDCTTGAAWLTGFGCATPVRGGSDETVVPVPAATSLPHIAPEQTGRMNRSVDSRSDLYSLGTCLYQMLCGSPPFAGQDPMELVHAHVARAPEAPDQRRPQIPGVLSALVMRLLVKSAEDRYQTANGLVADLRRCLRAWCAQGHVDSFVLGSAELSVRMTTPARLYGRARETAALRATLQDVRANGSLRLALVSGVSGIGKSSLVRELGGMLLPARGLFAEGKADVQQRDTPYSSIAQAMQGLLRWVLGQPAAELSRWQAALREAVGPNGQVVATVLPELALLLGPQPPLPALAGPDRQHHFQRVFQRVLQLFASADRSLVLFIDDMQWLDAASLALLSHLLHDASTRHLLLVGAYRSDEVDPSHALIQHLTTWRTAPAPPIELAVQPLSPIDMAELVADALHTSPADTAALAALVQQRTDGNPFFAAQFVSGLAEQGLLAFDTDKGSWAWDLGRVTHEARVDNVVELMVSKVGRLPAATQEVLKLLACMGVAAPTDLLLLASELDGDGLQAALAPAVDAGLLRSRPPDTLFVHDRVREAAYALVAPDARPGLHLKAARLLQDGQRANEDASAIFALVNQFNLGADCITSQVERDRVARLNLVAARRARASSAPASALNYAGTALGLMGPGRYAREPALALELQLIRAECSVLVGDLALAEADLTELQAIDLPWVDRAAVVRQWMVLCVMRSDYGSAVAAALQALQAHGTTLTPHPAPEQVQAAYEVVMSLLDRRSIEALIDLPLCTDADITAAMSVLAELFAPACFTDPALALLHLCEMVRLSLVHGLTPASAHGFAWFGVLIGQHFGHHREGYRFAALAQQLVLRHRQTAFEAKALFALEIASVWAQPLTAALATSRAVFAAGVERGDLAVACFACHHTVNDMLVRGDPLDEVEREIEAGLGFVRRAGFADVVDELLTQQRFVKSLRGQTREFGLFSGDDFDEAAFEAQLTSGRMPTMIYWYWVMKAQARFLAGRTDDARDCLDRAQRLQWSAVHVQVLNATLYDALVLTAEPGTSAAPARWARLVQLRAQLARWQACNPSTVDDKLALVDAEMARIEGREHDAERHYEQAIQTARSRRALPYEALASELAGRFYLGRGLAMAGHGLLRHARDIYDRWGASAKARQLGAAHAALRDGVAAPASLHGGSPLEKLDLGTVLKVSQAVAGEIELQKLVDTLMRLALEHAGAQRAMLMLPAGAQTQMQVQALAALNGEQIEVEHAQASLQGTELPATLLQYVSQSRQPVLLDDATVMNPFSADEVILRRRPRSVLCLPLLKQTRLVGLLYLENNLATHAFTPERFALLELLASQAAIALENAGLYEQLTRENRERRLAEAESRRINQALQESEGRFRRMAEATPDVIWITDLDPERVLYASPSFERIWGHTVEALYQDPRLWTAGIHPDDRGRISTAFEHWILGDHRGPWEAEFRVVQPGGEVRWIHERGAVIADAQGRPQRVSGISTDITARHSAEAALQVSEQRFALAVAGSNDGIWDLDFGNNQLFMSDRAQHLFGLRPGPSVRPRDEWEAMVTVHPDDVDQQQRQLDDYVDGVAAELDGEWRVRHPDGSFRWVRVRGLCVRDDSGRAHRLAGSISDIDGHKRTQASLQQAQRLEAVGTLASGIAHDFNNILGAILGFGEMSLRNTRSGSRLRRDLECIMTAGERGRALVERILAFSRSGGGERVPVHVEGVVREAMNLMSATLPAGIQAQLQLQAGTAAMLGDATQVHQVVVNLATNAVQAMPEGGTLRVMLETRTLATAHLASTGSLQPGEYLVLTVDDTGSGIGDEVRERIFDPFVTTKKVGAGSGLGLSLVHGIVTEVGGAVDVASAAGQGSRFTVYLPRAGDVSEPGANGRPVLPRGQHQQVLVVDDEELLVRLTTEILSELGYVAVGFTSSTDALAAFRAHPERFDAVLSDERMPDMSGSVLVGALRDMRPDIPVVMMSGLLGPGSTARARAAGVHTILNKPVSRRDLAAALANALREGASGEPAEPAGKTGGRRHLATR